MEPFRVDNKKISVAIKQVFTARNGDRYSLIQTNELWVVDNEGNMKTKFINVSDFRVLNYVGDNELTSQLSFRSMNRIWILTDELRSISFPTNVKNYMISECGEMIASLGKGEKALGYMTMNIF